MFSFVRSTVITISFASAATIAPHDKSDLESSGVTRKEAKHLRTSLHPMLKLQHKLDRGTGAEHNLHYTRHKSRILASSTQNAAAVNTESKTSARSNTELLEAYGVAIGVMILVIAAMFYQQGFYVCLQIVIYVSCLAFIKIALKLVYEYNFNYSKFITASHLLTSALAAFVVLLHRKLSAHEAIPVPTAREFFAGILPIASTFGFSIACENSALVFVSAAFSEVVASSNPVVSAFLIWALGMPFPLQLLMPIGVVVLGCAISVTGELYFSSVGLVLLLLSVLARGVKAVLQQKLMTGETKEKFDPVTLMAWSCLCAFLVVGTYSALTEKLAPLNAMARTSDLPGLLGALFASCVIACTLNISALFVIKQLGAVGMQMVSQMKAMLVVIGGITVLGETFTAVQWGGFAIVLCGVYWYSYMQRTVNPNAKGH